MVSLITEQAFAGGSSVPAPVASCTPQENGGHGRVASAFGGWALGLP